MKKVILSVIIILITACSKKNNISNLASAKEEVMKVENDFKRLSKTKGIAEAFYTFADSNAVIKREHDTLIQGKENIKIYYSHPKFRNASVSWKPDFVQVSNDGTLAYTYGKYVWIVIDSAGNKNNFTGIFHTVWKRQKDGSWKYIWD